jgi:hypothetical protein
VVAAFLRAVWLSARAEGRRPGPRTGWISAGLALWLALAAGAVASGWVEAAPVHLVFFGASILCGSLLLGLSPIGKSIAAASPIPWLLAFQGFRLPLEWVLHAWVQQGVIPPAMTWTGSNWDILSGIAALAFAPFSRRLPVLAWIGNIFGLILLLNVGRVAVLSAPVPFGWADVTPKLQLPFHLPYALIIPICVGGALAGHVTLTRALLANVSVGPVSAAQRS